jgi:hypothetical protein
MNQIIETRIEETLKIDALGAQAFSQVLFGPSGLFQQLAVTESERQLVAQSALFQRANERLTALQQLELARSSSSGRGVKNGVPDTAKLDKAEMSDHPN